MFLLARIGDNKKKFAEINIQYTPVSFNHMFFGLTYVIRAC